MWWIYLIIYFIGAWGIWFFIGKFNLIKIDGDMQAGIFLSLFWPFVIVFAMIILPGYVLYQYGKNPNKNPFKP